MQGLEAATASKPGQLRGVIIFGPTGPLWTYYILVALSEGGTIRLNSLVVPHARITSKGTRTLSQAEFEQLTNKLMSSKLLREGDPVSWVTANDPLSRDSHYDLLVAVWSDGHRSMHFGELEKAQEQSQQDAKALVDDINSVLEGTKITYPREEKRKDASSSKSSNQALERTAARRTFAFQNE